MKKLLLFILCPFFLFGQTQIGNDILGTSEDHLFSSSVSLNSLGDIIAISSPTDFNFNYENSYVTIYKNLNNSWNKINDNIIINGLNDNEHTTVSLNDSGNIVAIGAPNYNSNIGLVRIFKNINNEWKQIGNDIKGDISFNYLGTSVSLNTSGNIVAISAPGFDSAKGLVRIYRNNNGNWEKLGNDIIGNDNFTSSGQSIKISSEGTIVAISVDINQQLTSNKSGQAKIYKLNNNIWKQLGNGIDRDAGIDTRLWDLTMSGNGDIVALSAPGLEVGAGRVRVYKNISNNWTQIGDDILGDNSSDFSGHSLSLDYEGLTIAISSPQKNIGNLTKSGEVRVFQYYNSKWNKIGNSLLGDKKNALFGTSISLSSNGKKIAIGAKSYNVSSTVSGQVKVYDLSAVLSSDSFVLSKFSIFPNPVKNKVTVQLKDNLEVKNISIYNSLGQLVKTSKKQTIDTSSLSKGIYFLQIETDKGKATKKLVIE